MTTEIPKHFCPQPFNYLHTSVSGRWKPCCRSYWSKKAESFEEWWFDDPDLAQLRSEMLTSPGEMCKKVCEKVCYDLERRGVKSYRNDAYHDFISGGLKSMELIDTFKKTSLVSFTISNKSSAIVWEYLSYLNFVDVSNLNIFIRLKTDINQFSFIEFNSTFEIFVVCNNKFCRHGIAPFKK